MTSKLVVNTIEADTGISSVSFASSISMDSTSKFHFSAAGVDIGADTNINRPAAGVLAFNINSSEKVRITSDGKVGIGSVIPANSLDVQGTAHAKIHIGTTGTSHATGIQINHAKGNAALQEWQLQTDASADGNLLVRNATSGTSTMFFDADNNHVGINDTSPDTKLSVNSGATDVVAKFTSSDSNAWIQFRDNSTTDTGVMIGANGDNLLFRAGSNERARITSGGAVLIGDTTATSQNDRLLQIGKTDRGATYLELRTSTSGAGGIVFSDGTAADSTGYRGTFEYVHSSDYMIFKTAATERLRIHSDGRMSFLNTTFPYTEHFHFYCGMTNKPGMSIYYGTDSDESALIMRHGRSGANSGAYTGKLIQFRNSSNNENGSIASNASVTAYNTSSDYRLKENEVTISDAISKVKQLKPYTFNFKVTPDQKVDGFFAHEAQEVVSYAVLGEKDAEDMQQMDYGKLTPLLTAALQEAITEIESLKAEVAALKSS